MITAYLRQGEPSELQECYRVGKIRLGGIPGRPMEPVYAEIASLTAPVVLLSSYVWNHDLNMRAAREIRRRNPDAVVIVGGPEIPKWPGESEAFMAANPAVDVAVLGEGEIACAEVLAALASNIDRLGDVLGLVYRRGEAVVRTGDRERVRDLERLPSPYLSGEFDAWIQDVPMATLETNRGCPYGCTYCDWGSATLQRVAKFNLPRIEREIDYLARSAMEEVFIADANFGMLEQDIDIARALVKARARHGFPRRLYTNFAKNGGRRLMEVISILHKGGLLPTGIVALQTTDPATLKTIQRDNIRTASYEKMMSYFNREGIPMASDLMIGLPGQTVDSFHEDLQFCFDWKISANGNYTSMMPNAPMAEPAYRAEHAIKTDGNSMIASTATFSADDLMFMRTLYLCYQLMVRMALLKYFLYFLQIDHRVPAIDFLRSWLQVAMADDPRFPLAARIYREMLEPASLNGHWPHVTWGEEGAFLFGRLEDFYGEVAALAQAGFGVSLSEKERAAVFTAQAAVMPSTQIRYPRRERLPLDVVGYFRQLRPLSSLRQGAELAPLASFGPGELETGSDETVVSSIAMRTMLGHSDRGWELPSPLRFY
jgi:radical SAM superfamily enzyme YgiQ (UPF0313 family)